MTLEITKSNASNSQNAQEEEMRPSILGEQEQGTGNSDKGDYFIFLAIEAK